MTDAPTQRRANLTPEDLRDYYLEMGHRELAVIKERDQLRRTVEWLESCNTAAMEECQLLATRIADLELRVRILTLAQGCP